MSVVLSAILLAVGGALWGSEAGCWFLIAGQIVSLTRFFGEPITGLGSFVFMSVLFFALRPMYMLVHDDFELLQALFLIAPDTSMVHRNLFWASLGLLCFVGGGLLSRRLLTQRMAAGFLAERRAGIVRIPALSDNLANGLLCLQVLSWFAMKAIAGAGTSLYNSALGAYMYDLPAVMHGGQIACMMILLERVLQRQPNSKTYLGISFFLFFAFTLLMRDVSVFRGFYLTGFMIGGIGMLARYKRRVGYAWLIIPILVLLPVFRTLGEMRYEERGALAENVTQRSPEIFHLSSYWRFFDSKGDMNIFDSFIAASESHPRAKPYLLSWLYVPVHLVPRKIWPGKPERGVLQDHSFSNGAPYSPGIAGYFVLDGGRGWMLGCMAMLGFIVAWLDLLAMRIRLDWLRYAVYGVFTINAMFLTRFLLWQYAYQVLYMLLPCIVLAWVTRGAVRVVKLPQSSSSTAPQVARA